jgi:hypothetical protein
MGELLSSAPDTDPKAPSMLDLERAKISHFPLCLKAPANLKKRAGGNHRFRRFHRWERGDL